MCAKSELTHTRIWVLWHDIQNVVCAHKAGMKRLVHGKQVKFMTNTTFHWLPATIEPLLVSFYPIPCFIILRSCCNCGKITTVSTWNCKKKQRIQFESNWNWRRLNESGPGITWESYINFRYLDQWRFSCNAQTSKTRYFVVSTGATHITTYFFSSLNTMPLSDRRQFTGWM